MTERLKTTGHIIRVYPYSKVVEAMPRPSVRGKLVEAGLDTLHGLGFNGASIQDIVDAAGVPKGSFFNHFKSKELLALEVLDRYGQTSGMEILLDKAKAPIVRLREHFEYLAKGYAHWGYERGCLLGNFSTELASSHPQIREALKVNFEIWSGFVADLIREAQASGAVDASRDAGTLANFILNAWQGVAMRLKVVRDAGPADEFFRVTFDLLLAPPATPRT